MRAFIFQVLILWSLFFFHKSAMALDCREYFKNSTNEDSTKRAEIGLIKKKPVAAGLPENSNPVFRFERSSFDPSDRLEHYIMKSRGLVGYRYSQGQEGDFFSVVLFDPKNKIASKRVGKLHLAQETKHRDSYSLQSHQPHTSELSTELNLDLDGFHLSSTGLHRYFWFKPNDSSELVAARVLDINRDFIFERQYRMFGHLSAMDKLNLSEGRALQIIVEYVGLSNEGTSLQRRIRALSAGEISSLFLKKTDAERTEAQAYFSENMTINDMLVKRLAQSLNIFTIGFSLMDRFPSQTRPSDGVSRSNFQESVRSPHVDPYFDLALQEDYPYLYRFLPIMNKNGHPEVSHTFAGLDVRDVIKYFIKDRDPSDMWFYWVINEDGKLKILPHRNIHDYKEPPQAISVNLSLGRRIYASGLFYFYNGKLFVDLADGYEMTGSVLEPVRKFVKLALELHLQKPVYSVMLTTVRSGYWVKYLKHSKDFEYFPNANIDADIGTENYESFARGPRDNTDKDVNFEKLFKNMRKAKQRKWDIENETPISLEQFAEEYYSTSSDESTRIAWASYILNVNGRVELQDLKKAARRLKSKFHPDRNKNENAKDITQKIILAETILTSTVK